MLTFARKFADLGMNIYATAGTARAMQNIGITATVVDRVEKSDQMLQLMDDGKIDYIVYTGKTDIHSIQDYIRMHHHAILLGITTLTSLETANALADSIASGYTERNTELVDINRLNIAK